MTTMKDRRARKFEAEAARLFGNAATAAARRYVGNRIAGMDSTQAFNTANNDTEELKDGAREAETKAPVTTELAWRDGPQGRREVRNAAITALNTFGSDLLNIRVTQ